MKTLEEVKEYFKNAKKVRCLYDEDLIFDINSVDGIIFDDEYYIGDYYDYDKTNDYACIYIPDSCKFAEIVEYKEEVKNTIDNKVKNPNAKHYELWNDFETIDIIKNTLTEDEYKGFLKGNILKYKLRDKGQDESDKIKIQDYKNELNKLLK